MNNLMNLMRFWPVAIMVALIIAGYATLQAQTAQSIIEIQENKKTIKDNSHAITETEKVIIRIETKFDTIQRDQAKQQLTLESILRKVGGENR